LEPVILIYHYQEKAIRRVNVGGKLLTNLLKESVSYRQWNMMDEFHIVNEAKEKLCFVSTEFTNDMTRARLSRVGHRWFDREFLLPDFVNTFEGTIRLPPGLLREQHLKDMQEKAAAEAKAEARVDTSETQATDDNNNDGGVGDDTGKDDKDDGNDSDDANPMEEDDEDSDNETDIQRRKRILRQKEEEQRRRDMEEQERQALSLSVERFAIPEVLFCPSDIGLVQQVGIAQAIVQAIDACDVQYRAAMYHNILITGGNAKLPFFQSRLEKDLRSLAPNNYPIRVIIPQDPVRYAWEGANQCVMAEPESKDSSLLQQGGLAVSVQDCFVGKHDWEANKKKKGSKDHTTPDVWDIIRGKLCKEGFTIM
jgi:actin-related protein 6